jgi:hypothetical protein
MAKLMGSGLCEKGIVWWRDYRASRKVRSGFRNKMRVEATGIPKSAKRFSEHGVVDGGGCAWEAMFRLSLVFLARFQFGNEISLTEGALSSLVKKELITRPAKGRSTGTLLKMGNCACVLSLLR